MLRGNVRQVLALQKVVRWGPAGCHYSTPGYVVYYLMRSDPALMLRLQNGRFDAPGENSISSEVDRQLYGKLAAEWSSTCEGSQLQRKQGSGPFFAASRPSSGVACPSSTPQNHCSFWLSSALLLWMTPGEMAE